MYERRFWTRVADNDCQIMHHGREPLQIAADEKKKLKDINSALIPDWAEKSLKEKGMSSIDRAHP